MDMFKELLKLHLFFTAYNLKIQDSRFNNLLPFNK